MKKFLVPLCCVAAFALNACQPVPPTNTAATNTNAAPSATASPTATTAKKAQTDLEQLAQRLVTQSAGVKEGDIVLISGRSHDAELMENIAVNVRKLGAFPWIEYSSDRLSKRLFDDVPDKYDSQTSALGLKLAEMVNVSISVGNDLTEDLFAGADPKRMAARGKAGQPVADAFLKNNVRTVEVGNGLYPTDWRAKRFGMPEDELSKTFWGGVNVDYAELQTRGEQVKSALSSGDVVQIKDANGTDLKVSVKGRPFGVSDGIISEADAKQGGAAVSIYLPAGEVYVSPVAGTAEGKIVRPKEYFQGKEIQNLTLTFAGGKLTGITGTGPGFEPMKAQYDAAGDGRDIFAVIDFGINANVKLPASSPVGTWVPAGSVTVGMGNNAWAGGDNKTSYSYFVSLPGTTVTLDGKPVIENGQLKL